MKAPHNDSVRIPSYFSIIFVRQLDFLLSLMPIMVWGGIVYYFLVDQDQYVNLWLESHPFWVLVPIFLTLLSLMLLIYRIRQVRHIFYHGKTIKGQVMTVGTKRHLTRFSLPMKSIVSYQYHYAGKHYRRRTHLLGAEGLSPGMNVQIQIDPNLPQKGLIREIFVGQ